MMDKRNLPHIITAASFVVFIVLGLACATTPRVDVELGAEYQKYLLSPTGNERVIDSTGGVRGSSSFVCRDGQHAVTPAQRLGIAYQLGGNLTTRNNAAAAETEAPPSERHRHEPIFDQLLAEAKRQYPSEVVEIRNARTGGHIPTNARQEEYSESVRRSDGTYTSVTRTRMVWDCFLYYTADIITTEPMPDPVTHSENFTMPGATRADIYRRAINWIEDNAQRRRITVASQDIDRGRIRGTITISARADQTYSVTSTYTIDVYDARVEIRFEDTVLRRQSGGGTERIFLQSIADAAQAEIVDFSTTLRSYILSR